MTGELVFAFAAGSVATVNPCGFALLPAYMARRVAVNDGAGTARETVARAVVAGVAMTFGFVLIFGIGGGAIVLGAGWLTSVFPWAGLVIGIALAAAGLVVLSGRRIGLGLLPQPAAAPGGLRGDLVFGLGYGTASLSCTLPIFLAVVGAATTNGALAGVLSVGAYALGMGTIVVALAVGAALSKTGLAVAFKELLPYLPRVGGALLFLSGLYVAYFWGYTLFSDTPPADGNAIIAGERLSGTLRAWLSGAVGQVGTYGVLAMLLILSAWLLARHLSSKVPGRRQEAGLLSAHRGGLPSSSMEDRDMPSYAVDAWHQHGDSKKPAGTGRAAGSVVRSNLVTIGQLARETGVTPRAIRHYERLGLIETPVRTDANYRLFDSDSVSRVKFIAKCRSLGFSIPEISNFLRIMEDPDHTCAQVADLTRQHLDIVDSKMKDLAEIRRTLARNLAGCTGKEAPECPVLDFLQKPA